MRTGIIAQKLGMTRVFQADGRQIPVTVLHMDGLRVTAQRTKERDGYTAVQLGAGSAKASRTPKSMRHHFAKAGAEPRRKPVEFRVSPDNPIALGAAITAAHFPPCHVVAALCASISKGFASCPARVSMSPAPRSARGLPVP